MGRASSRKKLKKMLAYQEDVLAAVAEVNRERERARIAKENSGIRGFFNKVRGFFNRKVA